MVEIKFRGLCLKCKHAVHSLVHHSSDKTNAVKLFLHLLVRRQVNKELDIQLIQPTMAFIIRSFLYGIRHSLVWINSIQLEYNHITLVECKLKW